jgi:hypothetical protein
MTDKIMTGEQIMQADAELQKQISKLPVVHLSIEFMQGSFYAWDAETNKFLGQGITPAALFERLAEQATKSVMYRVDKAGTELLNAAVIELSDGEISAENT